MWIPCGSGSGSETLITGFIQLNSYTFLILHPYFRVIFHNAVFTFNFEENCLNKIYSTISNYLLILQTYIKSAVSDNTSLNSPGKCIEFLHRMYCKLFFSWVKLGSEGSYWYSVPIVENVLPFLKCFIFSP
jgi:hypothetical protein